MKHYGRWVLGALLILIWMGGTTVQAVDLQKFLTFQHKKKIHLIAPEEQGDIISYASKLSQHLYDLKNHMGTQLDVPEIRKKLDKLAKRVKDLSEEITFFKRTEHLSFNRLLYFKANLLRINREVLRISRSLTYTVHTLMEQRDLWLKEKEGLPRWRESIVKLGQQSIEWQAYKSAEATVRKALKFYSRRLRPLLVEEEQIAELQQQLHALFVETDRWIHEFKGNIFERNSPSIFSSVFYRQFHLKLWRETLREIELFIYRQGEHVLEGRWILILIVLITVFLGILIYQSGRRLGETEKWRLFAQRPIVTAIFICLSFFEFFVEPMPPGWEAVFQFAIVITVVMLSKEIFKNSWKGEVLYRLAGLILIVSLFRMVIIPRPLLRIVVFLIALAGIAFCIWESCHKEYTKESPFMVLALRFGAVILVIVLIAEISGYANFSLYLLDSFLMTGFSVLEIWMLYFLSNTLLEFVLRRIPVALFRDNVEIVHSRLKPLIHTLFVGLFIVTCLVIWQVYTTEEEALQHLLSLGFMVGDIDVTVGLVLSAGIVLYSAFLISWSIQAILLQEVLPRRRITRGVQLSIARLVHYGIIFIGFLVMLRTLGFGLTNLTIIGGALGVGIGFGLQAIVNNFASGLILLFERPIKIGDTIQVDRDMAVVKRMGLRSTVVQTLDNAEIVIPNSDLVTHQVTNWTLANRLVRVRIPVGVAYGSDIEKVTQILRACAEENPKVLKRPATQALFLGFGDSALNFELRVWISEFMESTGEVQSELNRAINEKFNEAGIEIPFPQTDLHVRSVDEAAARALKGDARDGSGPVSGNGRVKKGEEQGEKA